MGKAATKLGYLHLHAADGRDVLVKPGYVISVNPTEDDLTEVWLLNRSYVVKEPVMTVFDTLVWFDVPPPEDD